MGPFFLVGFLLCSRPIFLFSFCCCFLWFPCLLAQVLAALGVGDTLTFTLERQMDAASPPSATPMRADTVTTNGILKFMYS